MIGAMITRDKKMRILLTEGSWDMVGERPLLDYGLYTGRTI